MAVPPRSGVASPIKEFIYIPSDATCDAVNALVGDINLYLSTFALGRPVLSYTLATLPATAPEGTEAFVSDGKKIGEEIVTGTGIWTYFSLGVWRRKSTDSSISAANPLLDEAGGFILDEAGGQILSD